MARPLRNTLPFLYAITDPALSGFSHIGLVEILVANGVRLIQIREKEAGHELLQQAHRSVALARKHDARIIINDRVDVAQASGADGVHLGKEDMRPEGARNILGQGKIIGVSARSVSEAITASLEDTDYVAIGPIFATSTKKVQYPPLGLKAIAEAKKQIKKPLVAIGGITLEKVADVFEAGADSIAVISDLLCRGDIGERVRLYLSAIRKLKEER